MGQIFLISSKRSLLMENNIKVPVSWNANFFLIELDIGGIGLNLISLNMSQLKPSSPGSINSSSRFLPVSFLQGNR